MKFFVAALLCAFVAICNADVPPLSVKDNQILIDGKPGMLSGNSLFWSNSGWGGEKFYNEKCVQWLKKDWNSTVVRCAMGVDEGGGYLSDPENNKARVKTVVEAAIKEDLYVIVDFHSHNAQQHQNEAITFFKEIATAYGKYNNLIYELFNEPTSISWSNDVKPYAVAVIKAIREIDEDNLILVGSPHWCQDVDAPAADPITGYLNIGYSLHFYSGTHHQDLRDKAAAALKKIPIFVTEWGAVNADGNGGVNVEETNAWMKFLQVNNISSVNWSLNDKQEGASSLRSGVNPEGGWSESDLTESGKFVRNLIQTGSTYISSNNKSDNQTDNKSGNQSDNKSGNQSDNKSGNQSDNNSGNQNSYKPQPNDTCSCCVCNCPS